jgi:hypothetical protein
MRPRWEVREFIEEESKVQFKSAFSRNETCLLMAWSGEES